jgi:spermidine synthase
VLALGFGLGSIMPLLANYKDEFQMTGVDIDPVIIKLARQYIAPELQKNLTLIESDAFAFINEKQPHPYDLIVIDLFIDNFVPKKFEKEDFLQNVKRHLSENGLLLYNRLANKDTEHFYNNTFKKVYPPGYVLSTKGNHLLVYDKWEKTKE